MRNLLSNIFFFFSEINCVRLIQHPCILAIFIFSPQYSKIQGFFSPRNIISKENCEIWLFTSHFPLMKMTKHLRENDNHIYKMCLSNLGINFTFGTLSYVHMDIFRIKCNTVGQQINHVKCIYNIHKFKSIIIYLDVFFFLYLFFMLNITCNKKKVKYSDF